MKISQMRKPTTAYAKGVMGEDRACEYLQAKGMVLLHRRYRSLYGEIDLVMQAEDCIVFAEVKARGRGRSGDGLIAVTPAKQKRILQTAEAYLAEHGAACAVRFDVIEITPEGILHIPCAFDASDMTW